LGSFSVLMGYYSLSSTIFADYFCRLFFFYVFKIQDPKPIARLASLFIFLELNRLFLIGSLAKPYLRFDFRYRPDNIGRMYAEKYPENFSLFCSCFDSIERVMFFLSTETAFLQGRTLLLVQIPHLLHLSFIGVGYSLMNKRNGDLSFGT
jgi:hypothetical protein